MNINCSEQAPCSPGRISLGGGGPWPSNGTKVFLGPAQVNLLYAHRANFFNSVTKHAVRSQLTVGRGLVTGIENLILQILKI
jgi:hypothetical protein